MAVQSPIVPSTRYFSNMADHRVVFMCFYSNCLRQFRCLGRTVYKRHRYLSTTSSNCAEDEAKLPTTMFEYYQKNPGFLKQRGENEKFDLEKELEEEREKETRAPPVIDPENATWTEGSKRVGAIGVKLGMMPLWLKNGERVPVTLVQIKDCQVMATKVSRKLGGKDDITSLEVGAINQVKLEKMDKAEFGHFMKCEVTPKQKVSSFKVSPSALLHPGTQILGGHFNPGQFVTVQAKSKDKGFQGVMKRWGMKGQPASHGQTKTHRKMGATGGGGDPGRIWPGKKMPGHMGNKNRTVYAVKIYRINTKYNVLYIHGQIPGPNGGTVRIKDALGSHAKPPPFPTYLPHIHGPLPEEMVDESVQEFSDDSITFAKE